MHPSARKPLLRLLCTAALLALTAADIFADTHHQSAAQFKQVRVTDNILMLQGTGGNLALLSGRQGFLLVDDDYTQMSPSLEKLIQAKGGLDKLLYVINTHWHGDHTEGNLALGEYATIVAHNNVRTRLLSSQEIKLFNMKSAPYPEIALPSVTYQQAMSLHINGEEVELVHFANGHTDSDSVVFFKKSNVVHMGDHFFNGFFPFVDVDSGGNVLTMADNIKHVLERIDENTQVIPGHGPLATKGDLQAFHAMLIGTSSEVKRGLDNGDGIEAIRQKGLSRQWAPWTKGFLSEQTWISIIYNSLVLHQ